MWKVVTSSNLNPSLKLFFYSPILANNNLLLKIYYENIVVVFLNQDFFYSLYYFSFFHFILLHTRVHCPVISIPLLLFLSPQEHSSNLIYFTSEREIEREREREKAGSNRRKDKVDASSPFIHAALPNLISIHHVALPCPLPHRRSSSSPPPDQVRSVCSSYFLFIYFSYLLVLI